MTEFICADCGQPIETPKTQGVLTDMGWMHVHCDPRPCSCNALDWSKVNNGVGRLSVNEHHPACYRFSGVYWQTISLKAEDNMTELQLLVIDLGDCCVVKVEKGEVRFKVAPTDNGGMGYLLVAGGNEDYTDTILYRHPFSEVRAALEEKPLPRVERVRGSEDAPYTLHFAPPDGVGWLMTQGMYDALTELNGGKPLPIWSGGEWTQLPSIVNSLEGTEIAIWRHKR